MKNHKNTIAFHGKAYNVFTVHTDSGDCDVILLAEKYALDDSLAVRMMSVKDGCVTEPFTDLTVCVNPFLQSGTMAFVDTNNNPWAERFIRKNHLGKNTRKYSGSGFCMYPLYEFDTSRFLAQ